MKHSSQILHDQSHVAWYCSAAFKRLTPFHQLDQWFQRYCQPYINISHRLIAHVSWRTLWHRAGVAKVAKQMNLAVSNAPGSLGRSLLAFSARVLVCSGCLWSFEFPSWGDQSTASDFNYGDDPDSETARWRRCIFGKFSLKDAKALVDGKADPNCRHGVRSKANSLLQEAFKRFIFHIEELWRHATCVYLRCWVCPPAFLVFNRMIGSLAQSVRFKYKLGPKEFQGTPLTLAVKLDKPALVRKLIDFKADPQSEYSMSAGRLRVHWAGPAVCATVAKGNLSMMRRD